MEYKAFVSSTFQDLKEHRQAAIRQLRRSGFIVDPMEDWTADVDEPKVFCLDRIRGCDLCILLVGYRRGSVPLGQQRSITQMEYYKARELGIEVLPFLLDEPDELETEKRKWPEIFDDRSKDAELINWLAEIRRNHGVETFKADPATLHVSDALNRWMQRRRAIEQLHEYREAIRRAHGKVKFLGLPQLRDNRDIPIGRLFVDPCLSEQYASPDRLPENWPPALPPLSRNIRIDNGELYHSLCFLAYPC